MNSDFLCVFRWCVLAPLYTDDRNSQYAKLHLSALASLLEAQIYCPTVTQRNVVSAQHLTTLVKICHEKVDKILLLQ